MQIKKQLLQTKIIHSRICKMRMMLYENLQPYLVQEDVNEASSTDLEADVSAVPPPLANSGMLAEFLETSEISDGDDEVMDVSDSVVEELMECLGKNLTSYLHWRFFKKFSCFRLMAR